MKQIQTNLKSSLDMQPMQHTNANKLKYAANAGRAGGTNVGQRAGGTSVGGQAGGRILENVKLSNNM